MTNIDVEKTSHLKTYHVTPPGGYRYKNPEPESKGYVSTGTTFRHLVGNVEAHRRNMGYPVDPDLATTIDLAICTSMELADRREYCVGDATEDLEWPLLLQPMKALAQEGDRGLGDIVARVIGPAGGDAYKAWYMQAFNKACGCKARQDRLNARYPL